MSIDSEHARRYVHETILTTTIPLRYREHAHICLHMREDQSPIANDRH